MKVENLWIKPESFGLDYIIRLPHVDMHLGKAPNLGGLVICVHVYEYVCLCFSE